MLCAPLGGPLSAPVMDRDSTTTARGRKMSARRSGTWLSYHVSRLVKYYVENCERGILTNNTVQRINITRCYICPVHFIVKYVAPFWINLNTLVVIGKGCSVTLNQISWSKVKSIADFCYNPCTNIIFTLIGSILLGLNYKIPCI